MAPRLQPEAAARQPRPGAAPHVSAEAHNRRPVSFGTVRLTRKLTKVLAELSPPLPLGNGNPKVFALNVVEELLQLGFCGVPLGMSRALLKLSGSLVHDYATISDDSPSPNRASRARRAATSAGIS